MAQEFCSLEQAAQMLGISPQELNNMAQRRAVRAFADRGTWRFRIADVQELARRRGAGSDAEIPTGSGLHSPMPITPDSGEALEAEVLPPEPDNVQEITAQLAGDHEGDIFHEPPKKGSSRSTDSGIILVPKGSDVELLPTPDELGPASSSFVFPTAKASGTKATPPTRAESQLPGEDEDDVVPIGKEPAVGGAGDSQVRLDSVSGRLPDSGVRLVDFDIPQSQLSGILQQPPSSRKMEKPGSTINLDRQPPKSGKLTPGKSSSKSLPPQHQPTAQYDIEAQLAEPSGKPSSSKKMKPPAKGGSSSEFDLTPTQGVPGDSVFELSNPSMPSLELELTSDIEGADALGGQAQLKPEQGGTGRRKRPPQSAEILAEESSGTFELRMDSDEQPRLPAKKGKPESSEFDLSIEADQSDSSDFELALDDDTSAQHVPDSGPKTTKVPRQAAQAAEAETSDFELALDEDSSSEIVDETDSEVVVIDDDDATAPGAVETMDEEIVEEAEEAEPEIAPRGAAAAAAPADWGWWSMALLPTALIMPFVGLLLFEMMRSIWSYQQPYMVTGPIFEMIKSVTK